MTGGTGAPPGLRDLFEKESGGIEIAQKALEADERTASAQTSPGVPDCSWIDSQVAGDSDVGTQPHTPHCSAPVGPSRLSEILLFGDPLAKSPGQATWWSAGKKEMRPVRLLVCYKGPLPSPPPYTQIDARVLGAATSSPALK